MYDIDDNKGTFTFSDIPDEEIYPAEGYAEGQEEPGTIDLDEYQKQCKDILDEMEAKETGPAENKEGILEKHRKKKARRTREKAERAYTYRHLGYNRPYMFEKIRVYKVVLAILFIVFAMWFATSFFFIDMARYAVRG